MARRVRMVACFLVMPALVSAQTRAVFVQVGGGVTQPLGGVRDNFGLGWNLGMGFVFPVSDTMALQLDFLHARVADRSALVDVADTPIRAEQVAISATHFMDAGTVSLRFTPPRQPRRVRAYLLGGLGAYYRKVTLSSAGAGLVSVCNPWWLVCAGQADTVDAIVGRRNSVGIGVSLGGGVAYVVNDEVTIFLEARFHEVITAPSFGVPGGRSRRATGEYLPVAVGVRF